MTSLLGRGSKDRYPVSPVLVGSFMSPMEGSLGRMCFGTGSVLQPEHLSSLERGGEEPPYQFPLETLGDSEPSTLLEVCELVWGT